MKKQIKARKALFGRKDRKFTSSQQEFLLRMIDQGMSADQLEVIRRGFREELGIDQIAVFAKNHLDWKQMVQMCYCVKDGWSAAAVARLVHDNVAASTISEMRLAWAQGLAESNADVAEAPASREKRALMKEREAAMEERRLIEEREQKA
ncbi:MAG TPA: hypothetical protein DEB31_11360, partial [Clostridiales bacterium]|nr:hypothetical protein [Clostridiales bacterium]